MPTPKFDPYMPNRSATLEQRMKALENTFIDMLQYQQNFLLHLDSTNVKKLLTEYCSIRSEHGETTIQGPLLIMKDKQGTPVVRLKMGYDKDTDDFIYQLMNAIGDITVSIDSNGNLTVERGTFKGSITIGTGNNVIKADRTNGLWVGHATFASAPFRVGLDGSVTATNMTIIGGVIKTADSGARIEMSGNKLETYNSSNQLDGPVIDPVDGLIWIFKDGNPICTIGDGGTGIMRIQKIGSTEIEIDDHPNYDWVLGNTAPNADNAFGVFGVDPATQQTAAKLSEAGLSTIHEIEVKINGILSIFKLIQ